MDVLKQYLPLCWFKNHPLQLPSSMPFFKANLIFFCTIELLTLLNMVPILDAFVEAIMDGALTLFFVLTILSLNRAMHNYLQVASAILVCENLLSIFSIPVLAWLIITPDWLSYTALAGLLIWNFAIITYLLKKVLSIDILASSILAFVYFISTYGLAYSFTLLF